MALKKLAKAKTLTSEEKYSGYRTSKSVILSVKTGKTLNKLILTTNFVHSIDIDKPVKNILVALLFCLR